MSFGKVKWYDQTRGYGYIVQNDGQEIYFHYTSIAEANRGFNSGHAVTYDLIQTRLGFEAANVRLAC